MSSPTRTATLFGYLGGRNLGDDAMLAGLLSAMPAGWTSIILAREPSAVVLPAGVRAEVREAGALAALSAFARSSAVVRVGGTSFHDEYGGADRRRMAVNYLKLALLFLAARLMGRRVGAFGIGAGRMTSRWTRLCARIAYRSCRAVVARDPASAVAIAGLGVHRIATGVDLAFLQPRSAAVPSEPPMISVSLLDLRPYLGVDPEAQLPFWTALVRAAASKVAARRLCLLAFKDNDVESDLPLAKSLSTALEAEFDEILILGHGDGLERVSDVIGGSALVVATRYHAAVFAALAGRPTVIVPYNDKLRHLAADLGVEPADLTTPMAELPGSLQAPILAVARGVLAERTAATRSAITRFFS